MIFITGDCHADFRKFASRTFLEQKCLCKDDYVIICGDFGGLFATEETKEEKYWLDWLDSKPFTTLFCSGNHENFDRLTALPDVELCDGIAGQVRPSIYHLKRGEVYNLDGVKVFSFGGAASHDVKDGILDSSDPGWKAKEKVLRTNGLNSYRVKGVDWWKEELPSQEEMDYALRNLSEHDNVVDLIITHCAPREVAAAIGCSDDNILSRFLSEIKQKISYEKWFFGHSHRNCKVDDRHECVYGNVKLLELREKKPEEKQIYLWTEAGYSGNVPSLPCSGSFEVVLDTLNTTHENELELIEWAKADGFNAELGDGCVRIWRD